jgi:hypothetical protein
MIHDGTNFYASDGERDQLVAMMHSPRQNILYVSARGWATRICPPWPAQPGQPSAQDALREGTATDGGGKRQLWPRGWRRPQGSHGRRMAEGHIPQNARAPGQY